MTLSDEDRKQLIDHRIKRARESEKEARLLFGYTGSNLPPIPAETCHPFRSKPATF